VRSALPRAGFWFLLKIYVKENIMFYFNILWLIGDLKYVWNDDLYSIEQYSLYKTSKSRLTGSHTH